MLLVLAVLCLVVLSPIPLVAADNVAGCEQVELSESPRRTVSGAWGGGDADTLLLVDPLYRSILQFRNDGRRIVDPRSTIAEGFSRLSPIEAWPLPGGGMVVEGQGTFLTRVSPGLKRISPPYSVPLESGIHQIFPYRWGLTDHSLDRGGMVMCGEIQRSPDIDWEVGIFYIPLAGDSRAPIQLAHFDRVDLRRIGCRLGGQIIASVNSTGYVVLLDTRPEIFRVAPDDPEEPLVPIRLHPRPEEMMVRPDLPHFVTRKNYPGLMEEVVVASMPVELVGWEGSLYLLLREATPLGGTQWKVAKVDPDIEEGANVVVAKLDSEAPFVSMIPGPNRWAFVEKAMPKSEQDQEVLGFKTVPARFLRQLGNTENLCP